MRRSLNPTNLIRAFLKVLLSEHAIKIVTGMESMQERMSVFIMLLLSSIAL